VRACRPSSLLRSSHFKLLTSVSCIYGVMTRLSSSRPLPLGRASRPLAARAMGGLCVQHGGT
jgi:hypothetical protein